MANYTGNQYVKTCYRMSYSLTRGQKMIEEITAWKVGDKIFNTEEEAKTYDIRLELVKYFDNNPLYGSCEGCKIEGKELVEFIDNNIQVIEQYLSTIFQDVS